MKLLITLWELSALAFLALLGWLLWMDRKWRKQSQPPEPRIYRKWGRRIP